MKLNTVGSFYAYRASKAGVNAIVRSLAVDLAGRGIIATAIHPGFVRTDMSGPEADIDPGESAAGIFDVIEGLQPAQSGQFLDWQGQSMPW